MFKWLNGANLLPAIPDQIHTVINPFCYHHYGTLDSAWELGVPVFQQ
jgi:hypothetical protein